MVLVSCGRPPWAIWWSGADLVAIFSQGRKCFRLKFSSLFSSFYHSICSQIKFINSQAKGKAESLSSVKTFLWNAASSQREQASQVLERTRPGDQKDSFRNKEGCFSSSLYVQSLVNGCCLYEMMVIKREKKKGNEKNDSDLRWIFALWLIGSLDS